MKKTISLLIIIALISKIDVVAQQNMTLYYLHNVPQSTYENPAFDTGNKHASGIPLISSIYLKANNTFLQPKTLFSNTEGQVSFNTEKYLSSLKDQNHLGFSSSIDIFSESQKIAKFNVSLAMRERIFTRVTLPRDFLAFPFTGNAQFDAANPGILDFSGLKFDAIHYRELSAGVQTKIGKKLSIGGRLKYLYGYENIDFEKSEITWKTNPQNWEWEIAGQIEVNTSGIVQDSTNTAEFNIKEYIFKKKNKGLGLDLGMTYDLSDRLQLNASLIDLGYIKWKTDVETTVTNDAQFIYSGINVSEDVILAGSNMSDSLDVAISQLEDDFKDAFSYSTNNAAYKTSLLTHINLGANYKLKESEKFGNSVGLLIHTEFYKGEINTSLGLSFQQQLTKHFNTVLSYSIIDNDFKNLGAGLVLSFGKFQFYTTIDNLMALDLTRIKFNPDDAGIPIPSYSKNAQIQLGFNIVFPEKSMRKKGEK